MRELKFRAWDIDKQKYVTCFDMSEEGSVWTQEACCSPDYPNVIVEQYTGLKDRNGREIFEGDILIDKDYTDKIRTCKVEYDDNFAQFYCSTNNRCWSFEDAKGDELEVIGNIHENLELLGANND